MARLTASKAKKILKDGSIKGKPLTKKQKRFFGAVAGGEMPHKDKSKSPPAGTQGFSNIPAPAGGPQPPSSFSSLPSRQDLATAAVPPADPSHSPPGRPEGVAEMSARDHKGNAPQTVAGGTKLFAAGSRMDRIPVDVRSFDPLPERES